MNHTISLHDPSRPRPTFAPSGASATPSRASATPGASSAALDTLQARFALRVAACLTENADAVGADIGERLRFAREQALATARSTRAATADIRIASSGGAAVRGGWRNGGGWKMKLASVIPVFALVGGLVLIQQWQDSTQISTAAEIDAALLSDALPPTAYSDEGFAQYLKTPGE